MKFALYAHFDTMLMENGIEYAARYAVEHGYSGIEHLEDIVGTTRSIPSVKEAKAIKKVLDDFGLETACHSVYADLWTDESAGKKLREQAEIACELGSPYLHHTCLPWLKKPQGISEKDALDKAVEVACDVASYAARLGVTVLYEEQGLYCNSVTGFGNFLYAVRKTCPNVAVCGDMGNILFTNEIPEAFFAAYSHDIRHVHVKAYAMRLNITDPGPYCYKLSNGMWLEEVSPATQPTTMKNLISTLRSAGYDGYYALELSDRASFEANAAKTMQLFNNMRF